MWNNLPTEITYPDPIIKQENDAIENANNYHIHNKDSNTLYTNRSKTSEGVGAAFCQIKDATIIHSDKIQLNVHNTIYQAEGIAILECLLFIQSINCAIVAIFSDSQSVFKSLSSFSKDPMITEIQKIYSCLRKRTTINFYWCPGHVTIFGNEAVDNLAKLAVKYGRTPNFSTKLPLSHVKMLPKQQSLELWQNMWTTSTNGRLTFKFVPDIRRNLLRIRASVTNLLLS